MTRKTQVHLKNLGLGKKIKPASKDETKNSLT